MNAESEKQKMLALVQNVYEDVIQMVNSLSPEERKVKSDLKLWSAKDTLAHLVFWARHFNSQLEKSAKGEKVPEVEYLNQVNDGVLIEHMDQPLEETLQEFKEIQAELVKKYEAFSADDLSDPKKFTWLEGRPMSDRIIGNSVWHPASHLSDFYAKRQRLDFATKIQEELTQTLKEFPSWSVTASYNLACYYALNGMQAKAILCLKEAFQGRPDLIDWSKQDTDLDSLREIPEYKALY